jgi:glycosyltransferase involved in cell wall biosynthesis
MRKRLNILQVSSSIGWGGREIYPIILSEKLILRGYNIKMVLNPKTMIYKRAIEKNLPVIPLRMYKYIDILSILKLVKIIKREDIKIIHCHFATDLWLIISALVLSSKKPKIILTRHMNSKYKKMDLLHKYIYKRVDKFIAISEVVKESLLKYHPIESDKIVINYYGVDLNKYKEEALKRKKIREEFKIDKDKKIVGIVGRLDPKKGQKDFILASQLVLEKYDKVVFLIVGDDIGNRGYKKFLINLTNNLNLADKIIFTGHRDDIPSIMSSLDLFIFPSQEEAFGLVIIEAMAMKTPVIAYNSGAIKEIINSKCGILVPLGDIKELAKKIVTIIKDREKMKVMGEESRVLVEKRFNLEEKIDQHEELYKSLLQE